MTKEHILQPDTVILSTTDLQGNIVTCNQGFVEASGYPKEELIGQPQNIIRHPDMPKEAFKDFWDTIQDGRPWYGFVKNLRKDGLHYWVAANATPIYTQGKVTGYVSVRYPITEAQKQFAEQLYADVRAGKAKLPKTPKPKFDRWTLAGIIMSAVGLVTPYLIEHVYANSLISSLSVIGLGIVVWRAMALAKPNATQRKAIQDLGNGEFQAPFPGDDTWSNVLNQIRTRIGQNASDAFDAGRETAVLTVALNAASTCLMVTDDDFVIVNINRALLQLFKQHEAHIQKSVPHFKADEVVGSNIDKFHKNPAHQRQLLASITTEPWNGEFDIQGVKFNLTVVPIISQHRCVGYVIEWKDVTAQRAIEQALAHTIQEASNGVISNRIQTQGLEGFYLTSAQSINTLLTGLHNFISYTIQNIGKLALNQLDSQIDGNYAGSFRMTQDAINIALTALNTMVGQAQFTANQVMHAMQQLNQNITQLSAQIEQQGSAIERTSQATEHILHSVQQSIDSIHAVSQITHTVTEQVGEGNQIMEDALAAMQAVEASGQQISNIVGLIDSIAFQTNLLALNAAVEAARAGEHGRGFAVVAGEVRSLAAKSAEAAKDIKALIDTSVRQISGGSARAREASKALEAIQVSVHKVNNSVDQINQASQAQNSAITQVTESVTVLDTISQQGIKLVENTLENTQVVRDQIEKLNQLVASFTLSPAAQYIAQQGASPLADIKQQHLNWKIKIINVLNGLDTKTSVEQAANYHACGLGKWRASTGRQYEHLPAIQAMDKAHQAFHELAAKMVAAAQQKDHQAVDAMLDELNQRSQETIQVITEVEQQIARHQTPEFNQKVAQAKQRNAVKTQPTTAKQALPAPEKSDEWQTF